MNVLLIELNEITWDLVDPLVSAGALPTFARLKALGAWGTSWSVDLPPNMDPWITWTTVYTGKPQSEHGSLFLQQPPETIRARRLWELVNDAGRSIGVWASLNSWPPRPVNGFWVPDTFAPDPATYPDWLRPIQEVNLKYTQGYKYSAWRTGNGLRWKLGIGIRLARLGLRPQTACRVLRQLATERVDPRSVWRRVSLQPQINFDVFARLYRHYRPDFATFHTNHVAHYQHLYWRAMDPSRFPQAPLPGEVETYGHAIEDGYRAADRLLRRALSLVTPESVLVVASSMGQQPYVNHEFRRGKRLLRLRSFEALIDLLGLEGLARVVPTMSGQFNVYTRDEAVRVRVRELLSTAYLDTPDRPMFLVSCEFPTAFTVNLHQYDDLSPDSVCRFPLNGGKKELRFGDLGEVLDQVKSGYHHPNGVVMLYGRGIRPGPIAGEITTLDLAPTILALLQLPIPPDMTGRVLSAVGAPAAPGQSGARRYLRAADRVAGPGDDEHAFRAEAHFLPGTPRSDARELP